MRRRRCGDGGGGVGRGATAAKLELARRLRREPTQAERVLWQALRGRLVGGFKFRRQHMVAGFEVDLYCPAARLAIEVDGPVHESQQHYDEARDAVFDSLGIAVIRIRNDDVLQRLGQVRDVILCACRTRAKQPHDRVGMPAPTAGPGPGWGLLERAPGLIKPTTRAQPPSSPSPESGWRASRTASRSDGCA